MPPPRPPPRYRLEPSSMDMRAPFPALPEVTDADLQPGAVLVGKKMSGKLKLVYRTEGKADGNVSTTTTTTEAPDRSRGSSEQTVTTANRLKFRIQTRLLIANDYTAEPQERQFLVDISLTTMENVHSGSQMRLIKVSKPGFAVDLTGLTVTKRYLDKEGKPVIELDGERDLRVLIGDDEHVLFETRRRWVRTEATDGEEGWNFHGDLNLGVGHVRQPPAQGPSRNKAPAFRCQNQARPQQLVASTSTSSTSSLSLSTSAAPPPRFPGVDPGLLKRSSSASNLRVNAANSASTSTTTAARSLRPITAVPRLNFTSTNVPVARRSGPSGPASAPIPSAPAPPVPSAPPAPVSQAPPPNRIDLRSVITPAGIASNPRQSLPNSDTVSIAVSSSAEVDAVEEFTPSPALFRSRTRPPSVPPGLAIGSPRPRASPRPLTVAAVFEDGQDDDDDDHRPTTEVFGQVYYQTYDQDLDGDDLYEQDVHHSPGWTATPIAARPPQPSQDIIPSPAPPPGPEPEVSGPLPLPSPKSAADADGDISMRSMSRHDAVDVFTQHLNGQAKGSGNINYSGTNGHDDDPNADFTMADDDMDDEEERLERELAEMDRKRKELEQRKAKLGRRRTTQLAAPGRGTPQPDTRRHSMGEAGAVAGIKRGPETPVHALAESNKRPNLAIPFNERDYNSRADHSRAVDSVRKAEASREARFAQGLKAVQPRAVEHLRNGEARPLSPSPRIHQQASLPPPSPAQAPAQSPTPASASTSSQHGLSRLQLQRAAEAELRAERERQARGRAIQQQEARQAEQFEAEQQVQALTESFNAGGHKYTPLNRLFNGETANIMAVIRDPGQSRPGNGNTDCTRNVILTDPSLFEGGVPPAEEFVLTVFRKNMNDLRAFEAGCPILIRGAKISSFKNKLKGQLYSSSANEWITLKGNEVMRGPRAGGGEVVIGPEEYRCLNALKAWFDQKQAAGDVSIVNRSIDSAHTTRKERTLGEVYAGLFFDATVKVLMMHTSVSRDGISKYELYLTDGTVNAQKTRNFHGLSVAGIPPGGVICLTLFERPLTQEDPTGKVYFIENLRCKDYDGLELNWSNKVTATQAANGWRNREVHLLQPDDPKVKEINERLKALKAAERDGTAIPVAPIFEPRQQNAAPPPPPVAEISTAVFTRHNNSIEHPITSLADALADPTVPNKYRIQARVTRVEPVPVKTGAGELAITYCRKCSGEFVHDHCQSCNDTSYTHAEARWRILVFLEIDPGEKRAALERFMRARGEEPDDMELEYPSEVAVLLAGADADFLPALPALHTGPNEIRRARYQIKNILRPKIEDMLLGNKFNGQHTRPLIDWSIMKYTVDCPVPSDGKRRGKEESGVLLWKVFGMTSRK